MVSAGALSTDTKSVLIGVPALQFPFYPIGNSISVPEIAFFKTAEEKASPNSSPPAMTPRPAG